MPLRGSVFWARGTAGSLLGCIESSRNSREANKTFIEIVKPSAQFHPAIPCSVGRDKDEFDLTG